MSRTQRARIEPLAAEQVAPGVFAVQNRQSGGCDRVRVENGRSCNCADYQYRAEASTEPCKHIQFIEQISAGELCPTCGYTTCRPSCPQRLRRQSAEAILDE